MKWYHWLWVPVLIVIVVVAYVMGRRDGDLASDLSVEMDALEARAMAKQLKAEMGAEKARRAIEDTYKEKLEKLDEDGKALVDSLADDPVALADFLVRVGRG